MRGGGFAVLLLAALASMACSRERCNALDISCSPASALLLFSRQSTGRGFYTADGGGATITMYRMDPYNRTVESLGTVPAGGTVRGIAVDNARSILYATVISISTLLAFSIHPETGVLTQIRANPMPNTNGNFMGISPSGTSLPAVGATSIQAYTADSGTAAAAGSLIVGALTSSRRPAVDPQNRYVYFTDGGASTLRRQALNADGTMGTITNVNCGSQARSATFAQNGAYVHCFNPVTSNISTFRLEADGSLTQIGNYLPGVTGYQAGAYNRDESVLFVLDVTANLIRPHLVQIGSSVTMTPVGTPVAVAATGVDLFVEGSGQLLIALSTANVTVYRIGSDQVTLTQIALNPATGANDLAVYSPLRF